MNETHENDQDIQEAMRMAVVNNEPSDELLRELRVMASKVKPKARPWWQPGLAVAGAAALSVGVIVMTMTPSKAVAKTYDRLVAAAGNIRSFQFTVDTEDGGKPTHLTIVGADGRFSMRTEEGNVMRFDKGNMEIYDPKDNSVTILKLGGVVDPQTIGITVQSAMAQGLKEINLKQTLKDFETQYGKDHIHISPVTRENGKDVYHVSMDSPKDQGHVQMIVDAATDLPDRIQVEDKESGGTNHKALLQLRFDGQIDPALLNATYPKNAKKNVLDVASLVGTAMSGMAGMGSEMGSDMKGGAPNTKMMEAIGPMIEQALKGMDGDQKDKPHVGVPSLGTDAKAPKKA